jgi:hypothetical protein
LLDASIIRVLLVLALCFECHYFLRKFVENTVGDEMNAHNSEPNSKFLVVLSDDGFERLNSHSCMKGLLRQGKDLQCVDVDYGPLLRVKTRVAYSPNGTNEVKYMTLGLSLQYSDVSFVLTADGKTVHELPGRPEGNHDCQHPGNGTNGHGGIETQHKFGRL